MYLASKTHAENDRNFNEGLFFDDTFL